MSIDHIAIRGARQHNLKNISADIPRRTLTVITGLSGSGKSSLAFDTLYAEGQRRYVETLSAYARQFLDQMERPDVDSIEGLSPAIAIEQKTTSRSPRSTVGTITEIYDYLRVLWSSTGSPHCPNCGKPIARQSAEQILHTVLAWGQEGGGGERRLTVLAPIVRGRKGEFQQEWEKLRRAGFSRVRIDGETQAIDDLPPGYKLDKRKNHTIEAVVDRVRLTPAGAARLQNSIDTALHLAGGLVQVMMESVAGSRPEERLFSERLACPDCGVSLPNLEPRAFSFNSRYGACEACQGLGYRYEFDPAKFIVDPTKPLMEGALGPASNSADLRHKVTAFAAARKIPLHLPFADLKPAQQEELVHGLPAAPAKTLGATPRRAFDGIAGFLREWLDDLASNAGVEWLMRFTSPLPCPVCLSRRLRPESLAVKVAGLSIADFTRLPVERAAEVMSNLALSERQAIIATRVVDEVRERLGFLLDVGLGYLSLDRPAATLSGGEAQRIRLAGQIGSKLRGVLYVLDEPSIGLHPRDNNKLLQSLEHLRDLGNTVLVVEHDRDTIERADYVLDLGVGAGRHGGELIASGPPAAIAREPRSLTGQFLSGRRSIPVPVARRAPNFKRGLRIQGARAHNLKNVDVFFPAGLRIVMTGVSGAGKSTLVNDILYPAMAQRLYRALQKPLEHDRIAGTELFDKVIRIDQDAIGRSPRSNPATYTGLFAPIRDLFAQLPEARVRGYKPGRFSFNVRGGRCEACEGNGQRRIEMSFLPDVYVPCEVCRGRRYNQETLSVLYKARSIADLLESSVEEALEILESFPAIRQKLETLRDVGLGYLHLGQSATTLSGGEAQRIKLARELSKRQTGKTLYLLDEPTTGLHFEDVRHLLGVLDSLVNLGNTVLIIEHNVDVIKTSDWVIDLGPEGGEHGGHVVAVGTPEQVAAVPGSFTGQALRAALPPAPAA